MSFTRQLYFFEAKGLRITHNVFFGTGGVLAEGDESKRLEGGWLNGRASTEKPPKG